jgi:thiamine kinase-like enzyme
MQDDALARLRRLPIWPVAPTFEPIAGGRTNENFRVVAGQRTYFARVGVDLPHHGIRRVDEVLSNRLAATIGVAPAVIHAEDGIMITEFVEGRTLVQGEPLDDTTLLRIAQMLRCVCKAVVPLDLPAFDPIGICRRYLDALPAATLSDERRRQVVSILDQAPTLAADRLIHADLIPENVIVSAERVAIVDWEYAGRGDPAVDVSSVILHFGLETRQAALFIAAYADASPATVAALQPIMALREALWCEVQREFAGLRGDLAEYTGMCWRRVERLTA